MHDRELLQLRGLEALREQHAVGAAARGEGGYVGRRGVRTVVCSEDRAQAERVVDHAPERPFEDRLHLRGHDRPPGARQVAAHAAAAVRAEVLEELVAELDVPGGAEGRSEAARVGKGQTVGQLPQMLRKRHFALTIIGQQTHRCYGQERQSQADCGYARPHGHLPRCVDTLHIIVSGRVRLLPASTYSTARPSVATAGVSR